jgi:hypothetical protein
MARGVVDESMPAGVVEPSAELYPELAIAGGLAAALCEQAMWMGLSLEVEAPVPGREQLLCANVPTGRGRFGVNIGAIANALDENVIETGPRAPEYLRHVVRTHD